MRVVTLLPAATELLCAIPGGIDLLVGRSHECDYPPAVRGLPAVTTLSVPPDPSAGDTGADSRRTPRTDAHPESSSTLDGAALGVLRPDLLITGDIGHDCCIDPNGVRSLVSRLADPKPAVLALRGASIEAMLDEVLSVGRAIGLEAGARSTVVSLSARLLSAQSHVNAYAPGASVAVLDGIDPLRVAGQWAPQLVERAGGRHPLNPTRAPESAGAAMGLQQASALGGPSQRITIERLVECNPEWIVLAPRGVPLRSEGGSCVRLMADDLAGREWWRGLDAVRRGRVALVDGRVFARAGPRLVDALEWLVGWLNGVPHARTSQFPWEPL